VRPRNHRDSGRVAQQQARIERQFLHYQTEQDPEQQTRRRSQRGDRPGHRHTQDREHSEMHDGIGRDESERRRTDRLAGEPARELPPGLLAEYLESARSQLGVLAGLAHRIAARSADREALDALRREIHKVHGSAGSYGFMDASRLAAGMEATVKDWVARPDDKDVDRGSVAGWFVKRLAEMLGVEVPAAAGLPSMPRVGSPPRPPRPQPPPTPGPHA